MQILLFSISLALLASSQSIACKRMGPEDPTPHPRKRVKINNK